jgi:hypothetical protein
MLLLLLAITQLVAFSWQFVQGFRPGLNTPQRISLSWDMFTTNIERCAVSWKPYLSLKQRQWHSLSQFSPQLEWEIIFDRITDYLHWTHNLCPSSPHTTVYLQCFRPPRTTLWLSFPCTPK